ALQPIVPVFITYVLSFVFLGIYWNNHHHLIHMADRITGGMLWANLHLLFWLSLTPFATGWMGRDNFAPLRTAGCGGVLLCSAIAERILVRALRAPPAAPPPIAQQDAVRQQAPDGAGGPNGEAGLRQPRPEQHAPHARRQSARGENRCESPAADPPLDDPPKPEQPRRVQREVQPVQ